MKRRLAFLFLVAGLCATAPAIAAPFDNWAAIVVAADNRAASGAPTEVFDNARRDIANALAGIGFTAHNIQQYSTQPENDLITNPLPANPLSIYNSMYKLSQEANAGCFVYITTHGAPLGITMGKDLITQRTVGDIIDRSCIGRPTVIVVSACYSGMFIPVIRADNRFIFTAARADRTSFGCAEDLQYTYFDQCFLESMPMASDFVTLAAKTTECVAKREVIEGATPPSEPQVYIGATVGPTLPAFGAPGT